MYEMGIAKWKEMGFLWVEEVENIFSWKKMLNSILLFKYTIIEHVIVDCFILWNVLHYRKTRLVMLIDCKIDVRIWESEWEMGRNGERVVLESYLKELLAKFHLEVIFSEALQWVWN